MGFTPAATIVGAAGLGGAAFVAMGCLTTGALVVVAGAALILAACVAGAWAALLFFTTTCAVFAAVLGAAAILGVAVLALAVILPALVLAALAATAALAGFLAAVCALLVRGLAAETLRAAELRAVAATRRVAVRVVVALAALGPFAADLAFEVAVLDFMILAAFFGAFLADDFTLAFREEDVAALLAEAARPRVFAAVVLVLETPLLEAPVAALLATDLATDLERLAEPLARAAAVEAGTLVFLSAFLLEGIRGLLLCCPAVETGLYPPPDESRRRRRKAERPRKRLMETWLAPHTEQSGLLADTLEK